MFRMLVAFTLTGYIISLLAEQESELLMLFIWFIFPFDVLHRCTDALFTETLANWLCAASGETAPCCRAGVQVLRV